MKLPSKSVLDRLNALQINAHRAISAKPEPVSRPWIKKVRPKRTFKQVANILDIPERQVRALYKSAMKKIKIELMRQNGWQAWK